MDGDIHAGQYNHDAVTGECLFVSIEAAYRLGITVGLRLADLADKPVRRTERVEQDAADGGDTPATPAPSAPSPTPDAPSTDAPEVDVDAVARAFVRRVGTGAVDVDFDDESMRLHEIIPHSRGSQDEHTRWWDALDALKTKYHLSFEEFDAIESPANGAAGLSLEEGYVFGLAVGRQLRAEDAPRMEEDDELAALRAVATSEERMSREEGAEWLMPSVRRSTAGSRPPSKRLRTSWASCGTTRRLEGGLPPSTWTRGCPGSGTGALRSTACWPTRGAGGSISSSAGVSTVWDGASSTW